MHSPRTHTAVAKPVFKNGFHLGPQVQVRETQATVRGAAMSTEPGSEEERFIRNLEQGGVVEALTDVLTLMYRTTDRPADALEFVQAYFLRMFDWRCAQASKENQEEILGLRRQIESLKSALTAARSEGAKAEDCTGGGDSTPAALEAQVMEPVEIAHAAVEEPAVVEELELEPAAAEAESEPAEEAAIEDAAAEDAPEEEIPEEEAAAEEAPEEEAAVEEAPEEETMKASDAPVEDAAAAEEAEGAAEEGAAEEAEAAAEALPAADSAGKNAALENTALRPAQQATEDAALKNRTQMILNARKPKR